MKNSFCTLRITWFTSSTNRASSLQHACGLLTTPILLAGGSLELDLGEHAPRVAELLGGRGGGKGGRFQGKATRLSARAAAVDYLAGIMSPP